MARLKLLAATHAAILAAGLMAGWPASSEAAGPGSRTNRGKTGTPAAAAGTQAPASAWAELLGPREPVEMGDDREANVLALQRERLGVIRHRTELIRKAFAAGHASQHQLEHAELELIRAELELQNRPHLRVEACEKLFQYYKRGEEEAEKEVLKLVPGDARAAMATQARYTQARLARINAQINLEREKQAFDEGKPRKTKQ